MGLILPDDDEEARLLQRYAGGPVGTETLQQFSQQPGNRPPSPAPRDWGDAWRQFSGDVKTGAETIGGLLTADMQTPIAQGMRFPNLVIPEGATVEEWDSGPKFRLPDGSLKDPKDLPQRGTVLPLAKDPKGWGDVEPAIPGFVQALPTLGTEVGLVKPVEGGPVLGAGRRGGGARPPSHVTEPVPADYVPTREDYGSSFRLAGAPERPVEAPRMPASAPGAPSGGALPGAAPGRLAEGLLGPAEEAPLFDPVTGANAREGATQGMSPEQYQAWVEGRAGLLDPGVAALNRVSPRGDRGMTALPKIREMTPEQAAAEVRRNPKAHLIQREDGSYVGAPAWVRTQADINRMRRDFDAAVARGAEGSDWYDRVHGYIREVSGGDPVKMRQLAEEFAVFSAQADPTTNFGFSQQARNAWVRDPENPATKVRTGQQAETFNAARAAQDEYLQRNFRPGDDVNEPTMPNMREGKKTGIYRQHMDPTAEKGSTGTNDIWHARVFGYIDPKTGKPWDAALGEAQHTFLDRETTLAVNRANRKQLAGRNDWTAAEIQAAPWVAAKKESLQSRYGISPEEAFRRATSTYPDVAPSHTASMPFESKPGASTGLSTGTLSAEDWHAMNRRVNPAGLDPTLDYLGFQQRKVEPATGGWREEGGPSQHNPADVSQPMIDYKTIDKKKQVHPDTLSALESVAAVRGASDMQIGTPVTMWNKNAPSGARVNPTIDIGRGTTPAEAAALQQVAEDHGMVFANRGGGAGFLNFNQKDFPTWREVEAAIKGDLGARIRAIVPDAKIGRADTGAGASESKYVDYGTRMDYANRGQGQTIRRMDEILQRNQAAAPGVYRGLLDDPNEAAHAQANLDRLQASGQIGKRPDYELWQRLIAEGRLKAALEWARAHGYQGLPAVAGGAVLGGGLLDANGSTGGGT